MGVMYVVVLSICVDDSKDKVEDMVVIVTEVINSEVDEKTDSVETKDGKRGH